MDPKHLHLYPIAITNILHSLILFTLRYTTMHSQCLPLILISGCVTMKEDAQFMYTFTVEFNSPQTCVQYCISYSDSYMLSVNKHFVYPDTLEYGLYTEIHIYLNCLIQKYVVCFCHSKQLF